MNLADFWGGLPLNVRGPARVADRSGTAESVPAIMHRR
jgi:hypothetical protein